MKYIIAITLSLALVLPVYASEVTGTLTTGLNTGSGVNGLVIEAPTANPTAGEYTSTQYVTLSGGAGTVSIHYTTDGSVATCTSGNVYTSPIEVASSSFIEAISCYSNNVASPTIDFAYAINPPTPTLTPTPTPSSGGGGSSGGGVFTTPATKSYDFNSDGKINLADFSILMLNWGKTNATKAMGDANGDGKVDLKDFSLLMINWSK